jgi:hypothetical protein
MCIIIIIIIIIIILLIYLLILIVIDINFSADLLEVCCYCRSVHKTCKLIYPPCAFLQLDLPLIRS